ncbi:MAG: acetylxylan esterase [Promethearchaeota archaeon]
MTNNVERASRGKRSRRAKVVAATLAISVIAAAAAAGWYSFLGPVSVKVVKAFPDPFLFANGTRASTPGQWEARREEIRTLLLELEYGTVPGRPDALKVGLVGTQQLEFCTLEELTFTVVPHNASPALSFNFSAWAYVPPGPGPFPAVVKVSPDGTGSQEPAAREVAGRGFLYVCFQHIDLDPDTRGSDEVGPAQAAYPAYSWGSLATWAWGAMRVADYLVGEPWVSADRFLNADPSRLVVTGHSRRGKAALLAGALDERFAMTAPSGSGCGGAGSFLVQGRGCETLASITSPLRYRSWFKPDFSTYAHRENELPFDQHFLRALVAPRLVFSTDGLDDGWANPLGTQAVFEASAPVFEFLNASKNNGARFRSGGHAYLLKDFEAVLDFANLTLLGGHPPGDFYQRPFEFDFPIPYSAPSG